MKTQFWFALMLAICAQVAYAKDGQDGNGGHVFVCKDSSGKETITAYDDGYDSFAGVNRNLGPASLTYKQKIQIVIDKVKIYSPQVARLLRDEALHFEDNAKFVIQDDLPLVEFPDRYGELNHFDPNCETMQFAVNFSIGTSGPHYLVSNDLWKRSSSETKAIMVIHEVFYRHVKSNSDGFIERITRAPLVWSVRTYVDYITSDKLEARGSKGHEDALGILYLYIRY